MLDFDYWLGGKEFLVHVPLPVLREIVLSSFVGLMYLENIGLAAEIAFLYCQQANRSRPTSSLIASILNFPLPISSRLVVQHCDYAYLIVDPENIGIAVGILLLSCVQAEICVIEV